MESFDAIWETIHNEQDWGRYPPEEVIRFVARNYYKRNRKSTKILEVGCGTGAVIWYAAREGFDVYGFDGSKTAIEKAHIRMAEEGLKAELAVCDAASIPYPDKSMDAVIDSAAIYANTVPNIRNILEECYRVLKTGGRIFSTGLFKIGMTGYGTGLKLEEHTYREITEGSLAHRGTVHFFSPGEINELWSGAGFKNIRIDLLERTDRGGTEKISYYMVEAEK